MDILGDVVGGLFSFVVGLIGLGLALYSPFLLFGWLSKRFRERGIDGIVPGVALRVAGIKLKTNFRPPSTFPMDYPRRYERARRLLRGTFRQPDPGALSGGVSTDGRWRRFLLPQWSVTGFDTPFVFVAPNCVQAMDLSPRRFDVPGLLGDLATGEGTGSAPTGGNPFPGTQFNLNTVSAGAECAAPGLHVVFRAKARGPFIEPRSIAECPCLSLSFEVAGWTVFRAVVPREAKPEWEFDGVIGEDFGIMDFAGEIPCEARIALFPGGKLDDFQHMVPLSNTAVGTIQVSSKKIPL